MKLKNKLAIMAMLPFMGMSSLAHAADVVIGVPTWPSVKVTAHILKTVLEENLGLEVELQNGDNSVIFEAMDKGAMHVHPEVWLPNQANLHDQYVKGKKSVKMNPNGVVGEQVMCVTKDTAERIGIESLSELTDPDMAKNFDSDGDGLGEMWIGKSGWASTRAEQIRAKSYGYAETMKLKEMDEVLALAEVDNAIAQGKNIVFFCYKPHHMFTAYDLVVLKEPAHDPAKWNVIQPKDDPEWLEKSSAPVAWDKASLHIHYSSDLEKAQPAAAKLLSLVKLNTDHLSAMTYALVVEEADAGEYAKKWVAENADLVDTWLK